MEVSAASAGAIPAAPLAIQADRSLPPRRRANEAVSKTSPAAAIAAGSRSSQTLSPNSWVAAAISGISGG